MEPTRRLAVEQIFMNSQHIPNSCQNRPVRFRLVAAPCPPASATLSSCSESSPTPLPERCGKSRKRPWKRWNRRRKRRKLKPAQKPHREQVRAVHPPPPPFPAHCKDKTITQSIVILMPFTGIFKEPQCTDSPLNYHIAR